MSEVEMSEGEKDFLNELTRSLLVSWAAASLATKTIGDPLLAAPNPLVALAVPLCLEYAVSKGWVSKKEPRRVLSPGHKTAASYQRR